MSKDNEKYYMDYPTRKIGKGNPYSCCASCGRSVPEINGQLDRHLPNCEYRLAKEKEILNEGDLTMDKVVTYLKEHLTVNVFASRRWGVEVKLFLDGEEIASDCADLPECDHE